MFLFILVGAVADAPHFEGKNIVITYINGDACPDKDKQQYETKITFICDHGSMVGLSLIIIFHADVHAVNYKPFNSVNQSTVKFEQVLVE